MKTLKSRLRRQDAPGPLASSAAAAAAPSAQAVDWNKYDDRLMKAAERGDVEKVASILAKKGVNPGKLDVEGRSAFHVVASKGNLECLNAILVHGVDITGSDTAGRNALHLAAKYGHALCLQKLLQHNCPTELVDLQGRTALHDAAMADCPSSIQLLCDHGASVNVKDVDGRTPLVLATQMCRPTICQLLIDRGADVNSKDKQNRTALMLGCEYGCRDAVEVLIRNGADITLLDALGNDSSYYARIGDNLDILTLLKNASGSAYKGREPWKKGPTSQQRNLPHFLDDVSMKSNQRDHQSTQDLETENEDLKDRLRKIQQEQRILLDKVNGLQLQLNEEILVADDLQREKETLKSLLATKEKQQEESLRTIEALKNRFKSLEGDHLGSGIPFSNRKEDMLLKQGQMFPTDSQAASTGMPGHPQSRSMLRPLELSLPNQASFPESEVLKKELEAMRSFCESAQQDRLQLQNELAHKVAECKALALECERVKEDSDEQVRQLEDALKDVQKRMYESEGKVKQMQAHFLALKEHLAGEAAAGSHRLLEELKEQLRDTKAQYEGASAEVGTLRHQLRQSELLVGELQRGEGRLREENQQLHRDASAREAEQEKTRRRAAEAESQLRDLSAQLALSVPAERFESVKSCLSREVDEKARKVAELERECEKSRCEIRQLQRDLEASRARLAQHVQAEDHEQLRNAAEKKAAELGKKVAELTLKNQALQKDVDRCGLDNRLLSQQVHSLKADMKTHYVPLKASEDLKRSHGAVVEDLNKKLLELSQKYAENKLEAEKLLVEKDSLSQRISHLEAVSIPPETHEKEVQALKSTIAGLEKQFSELHQQRGRDQETVCSLRAENARLKATLSGQYVPVRTHEEVKAALSNTLDKANRELVDVKKQLEDVSQQLASLKEQNQALKGSLRDTEARIGAEYVSLQEHEQKVGALRQGMEEAAGRSAALLADCQRGQAEIATLHAEMAAQKRELDTIQECIKVKYAPLVSLEESERRFRATERELREQLAEQARECGAREEEAGRHQRERDALQEELRRLQEQLTEKSLLLEDARELERASSREAAGLRAQLADLAGQHQAAQEEREKLAGEHAKQLAELSAARGLLQAQQATLQQAEAAKASLHGTVEQLRVELGHTQQRHEQERQAVAQLQQRLENQKNASVPLAEHLRLKEALERDAELVRASLREKEEESQARTQEVCKLQAEVQSARQALKSLETREVVDLSKYRATKSDLEAQVSDLSEKLAHLNRKYEDACAEGVQKRKLSAKEEKEPPLQVSFEQEIKDRQERCDKSLSTIAELQSRIQDSARQIEAKDNKITELLTDVERLKQAVSGLSQLTYASGSPSRRQSQQVDSLQLQVKTLRRQLADADRQHQEVIAIYRTHLLSAAQGHMDEDVQAALLQIIQMRQGLVC